MQLKRLRELRKRNGYTQKQVAALLGISERQVSYHETRGISTGYRSLVRYAELYGVSVDHLLELDDRPERKGRPRS